MIAETTKVAVPKEKFDWESLRTDFPILDQKVHGHPLIYFDNAATIQKPPAVLDALRHYYERDNANVHRGIHELSNRATAAFEAARSRTARFINARSADERSCISARAFSIDSVYSANCTCARSEEHTS